MSRGPGSDAHGREQDLEKVRTWFLPAFEPGEVLHAALAATPFRLTVLNSLVATGKALVGHNQARVLLLTDRAIHVVRRRFWRRRFRGSVASFRTGTVVVRYAANTLWLDETPYYLNPAGYQMAGVVGSEEDLALFVGAGTS